MSSVEVGAKPHFTKAMIAPYLFIAPAVAIMLGGLCYPVFMSVYLSFYDWKIGSSLDNPPFVGFEHFIRMGADPQIWEVLWVTVRFGFHTIVIEMTLGTALALLLEKPIRGASLLRTIFVLPLMVSPIIVGFVWRYLFDARIGWINYYLLHWFGIAPQIWLGDPQLAFFAIVFTDVWQWTPFIFIIVIAGLQALPPEIIEATQIDGANWWQQIIFVKLPMIKSILIIALLMRLVDVFRSLEVMLIMTNGGPGRSTELLSLHIYKRAFETQQLGYASAISVLLIVLVFAISALLLSLANPMRSKP